MRLLGPDQRELMLVSRIEREPQGLVIRAKVFGTMPVTAILTPDAVRAGLRLLGWSGALYLLTMPLRRSRPRQGKP
ncbi:MAG: hypothetical protein JOY91_10510 [Sinobacteraceae bacterium]|nr:hypothetical protein [Nevskiaceae bacterium]